MTPNPLFYQLLLAALVLVCLTIHVGWPDPRRPVSQTSLEPAKPRRKRSKEPKLFAGYIHKPLCTPVMAAGLTDHVWSLKEVLFYRVPPWPQGQTV
jgi:hypothetical protein